MKKLLATLSIAALGLIAQGQSIYPGQFAGKMAVETPDGAQVLSFDLSDVSLLPSRFRDNLERDSAWMANIDINRLVHSFRNNAGVFASREGGYMTVKKLGGWESLDCDLRGHTTGHLMSAYGLMYAATGADIFKQKGDSIVSALAQVQNALGTGYVSAFPEELINRAIAGKSVWAPWYTLHKILSGLIDQYLYAGNDEALEVAKAFGNWAYDKLSPLDDDTRRRMLRNEFGGMNEAFYNLYAVTGDDRFSRLGSLFYHNEVLDPLKAENGDFGTRHTNTFIPKVLGEVRNYELTGNPESLALARFFWDEMTGKHIFATGSLSDKEHFFPTDKMCDHLSGYTGETCCTYNLLKLTRHLMCADMQEKYADYYERALLNHILGQQDPESGMVCYFMPLLSGAYKVYSTPENSFWCCVGSGFENHAKYGEGIYMHNSDSLFVNLFIPSELRWNNKGLRLVQHTDFPVSGNTQLTVEADAPVSAAINIRYPRWSGTPVVKVNGKRVKVTTTPGSYISLQRRWRNGDRIECEFPMSVRVENANGDDSRGALMYGPVVLAGVMGTEGISKPAPFSDPAKYNDYYTYNYNVPSSLCDTLDVPRQTAAMALQRKPGTLTFFTPGGTELRPLFDIHRQRYVVYWKF